MANTAVEAVVEVAIVAVVGTTNTAKDAIVAVVGTTNTAAVVAVAIKKAICCLRYAK